MATMTVPNPDPRDAVLEALGNTEHEPMDLLKSLGAQGFGDADIKQAISELIHEGKIELTTQRMLKVPSQPAA
jgi:hypothetical protein